MKATTKKLVFFGLVLLSGYGFVSSAIADPCADVKAGRVEFMSSQACIDECAVDGVHCPYTPGANVATPSTMSSVAPVTPETPSAVAPYTASVPVPEDGPKRNNSYIVREENPPEFE